MAGSQLWLSSTRHVIATLYRGVTSPRRLLHEMAIQKDFRNFRSAGRGVLDVAPPVVPSKGSVLLVSLSGSIYSTKIEGMLAKALVFQGYTPVVLTWRNAYWVQKYFSVYGISNFLFIEDCEPTQNELDACQQACDSLMGGRLDLPSIKKWTFEGADVGQYAISTTARLLHRGMPDLCDAKVISCLRQQLFKSLRGVFVAKHLFDRISPELCIFNEVNYSDYGPVYAMALRLDRNVIQYVNSLRDNAFIFKRLVPETHRINPNSISRSEMERLASSPWTDGDERALQAEFQDRYGGKSYVMRRDQKGKLLKDRDAVCRQLALDPSKKTVVVFSHILWDANLFYGDDLFDDNEHWFIETIRAACRNNRVNWVIRLHPAISWKREWDKDGSELNELAVIRRHFGELPSHVRLLSPENDISSYSIFQITDFGVTIRGTVGIELPCFGVPVLTAGTGRYSGFGFTIDSVTREEYVEKLLRIEETSRLTAEQIEFAKKHAYAIFRLRPWEAKAFAVSYKESWKGFHPLNPNLSLKAKPGASFQGFEDMKKFAEWAMDRNRLDYLEPWPAH